MTSSLEADVAYISKVGGVRQPISPAGFSVRTAARKTARGRDRDLLFVALLLHPRSAAPAQSPAPTTTASLETRAVEMVDLAAKTYFGVPGSVTSALRETARVINLDLVQWNLRGSRQGINAQGSLVLAVMRHSDLYLAQTGTSAAVVVRPTEIERFPPESRDTRPLGISQTIDPYFATCALSAGDFLVLASEAWADAAFAAFNDLTLELAADRLAERASPDASGLVARFLASGQLQPAPESKAPSPMDRLRDRLTTARPAPAPGGRPPKKETPPRSARRPATEMGERIVPPPPSEAGEKIAPPPDSGDAPRAAGDQLPIEVPPALEPFTRSPAPPARRRPPRLSLSADVEAPASAPAAPRRPAKTPARDKPKGPSPLAGLSNSIRNTFESLGRNIGRGLNGLLRRVLPEGVIGDRDLRLPTSWMAAIAIGLPIVVGLLVAAIYIQRGRDQQYAEFLAQAQTEVSLARTAPDALSARPHWEAASDWLDKAEAVRPGTPEVGGLRSEAQAFVDSIDLTTRLTFKPLLPGGFGRGANLTNLVVSGPAVYALDPAVGRVFRAVRNESGEYALDDGFKCGAGPVGSHVVGPIVDMAWLTGPSPAGSDALMAMDGAATLVFCAPDGSAPLATQLTPPNTGWKSPRAIALYGDGLYVLDPLANEIWLFNRPGGQFSEGPSHFFTSVSYDLSQAIDFAIANGEVFILFGDGRMMICSRNADGSETTCADDVVFTDGRQGHTGGNRLDDLKSPLAILYDPPPEPSLYLADSSGAGLYQLSLKLVLQRQFRPAGQFDAPIAAIGVGTRKELFVASGDNVYVGARP